jgi:hypothetical protein
MAATLIVSDKKVEAIAFELAERFYKRAGYAFTAQDMDDLAEALAGAIHKWLAEKGAA